ncbi:hypothetical protein CCP4SC76_2660004 [Gammaproteobacteria bacterium]
MRLKTATVSRFLLRHASFRTGEAQLVIAVLCQAYGDLPLPSAARFIEGWNFEHLCGLVGLEPDFVRTVFRESLTGAEGKANAEQPGKPAAPVLAKNKGAISSPEQRH